MGRNGDRRRGRRRLAAVGAALALAGALAAALPAAAGALADAQARYRRVDAARRTQEGKVKAMFAKAGVPYPALLLVRAFKEEGDLELWAAPGADGAFVRVARFPFTGYSGDLGPKRRRWDRQIPEGFYSITGLNGASRYHLSLHVDYPNASDRVLADRRHPGNNIFIHGDEVTNGCIPIGNRAIEQLYLAVLDSRDAGHPTPVHIFPCRFSEPTCQRTLERFAKGKPKLRAFWANLQEGYVRFEATRRLPAVEVDESGRYVFAVGAGGAPERPAGP
jgi:murein L,D-transpeptidase YafK